MPKWIFQKTSTDQQGVKYTTLQSRRKVRKSVRTISNVAGIISPLIAIGFTDLPKSGVGAIAPLHCTDSNGPAKHKKFCCLLLLDNPPVWLYNKNILGIPKKLN